MAGQNGKRGAAWIAGGLLGGVVAGLAGTASANPALAENLRKSPVVQQAAGATTVADRLAERRFGTRPQQTGTTYTGTGYVLPRRGANYGGYWHNYWGNRDNGIDYDDPRLRDGFDLDHYDDEKPWKGRDDIGRWGYGHYGYGGSYRPFDRYRRGFGGGVRVVGTGYNTVFFNTDPFFGGFYNRWWDPYPYGIDGRLVYGVQPGSQLSMPAPATAPGNQPQQQQADPPTDLEAGRGLLSVNEYEASVERYRAHLDENPDDFEVMAELVVALAGAGRLDDAAALARLAYERDPALANSKPTNRVRIDSRELRKIVVKAVRFAHDRESASAWLLVSVLMQAEDRDPVGLEMLERSIDRGLPAGIADPLRAAMR